LAEVVDTVIDSILAAGWAPPSVWAQASPTTLLGLKPVLWRKPCGYPCCLRTH